ncbi:MAG: glycerophosphodiester phosphodiesterase [Acidimicrobiia bacterium]|nr:glycerophosphodiester phosphodiesterase [Acidimicrobiia bacterium]
MQQRLPSRLDPPIAFGHRGAAAHAPDNTLDSFDLALKLGASGLESDVWLTADGVPVLDHGGVVGHRLRRKPIGEVPRASLPSHIPALEDMLAQCGTQYHLSLDLKVPAAADAAIGVVAEQDQSMLSRLWLCHPSVDVLAALRTRADGARLLNSTRLRRLDEGPERRAARLASDGIDGINMHRTDWNGGLVVLFHRFERVAFGWDMQFEHELQDGLRMGLDAVYSDHVDVMNDVFTTEYG